ncbi:hypothetical protein [Priestia flexa]|uniref:hypothetical protein n=1 Tax=Priestia flexa TaxID=86664 RepID=UPI001F4C95E6|nr:hypothetical protein [Priestia flexa]
MTLSKESTDFLQNLRLYLFSSGKNEEETEDIILELSHHLWDAEQDGKSVHHIVGQSPKAYMESLSSEMKPDLMGWLKYLPIIILGVFAYSLLGDAIHGNIAYSAYTLIGMPIFIMVMLLILLSLFRVVAARQLSGLALLTLFISYNLLSIGGFVALVFLEKNTETKLFVVSGGLYSLSGLLSALVAITFLVAISIWSKTWVSILIPIFLYLPEVVVDFFSMSQSAALVVSTLISYGAIGLYIWLVMRKLNKEAA